MALLAATSAAIAASIRQFEKRWRAADANGSGIYAMLSTSTHLEVMPMATAKVSSRLTSTIPKTNGSAVQRTAWHQHRPLNQSLGEAREQPENGSTHFELIDTPELALRWSLPASWIREQTRSRSVDPIPHLRLGRYVRFEWGSTELEQWLTRRRFRKC